MNVIKSLVERITLSLRLRRYDEWTIENYLRARGMRIGWHNRIYTREFGTEPYLVRIGSHCTITAGVRFITHDGGAWVFREEIPRLNAFGKIDIRDNCFIGAGAMILPNITIGPNAVVGAGSIVTRDVPPDTVVAGVPARRICALGEYRTKLVKEWESLGLTGTRAQWKDQLIRHFWGEDGISTK